MGNRSRILPRKRLFEKIDAFRHSQIIWVTGPPGSGKTSLVNSYLENKKIPSFRYSFSADDQNSSEVFKNLRKVFQKNVSVGKNIPECKIPESSLDSSRLFGKSLGNEIFPLITQPVCFIFEDCHNIPASSPLSKIIKEGFEVLPEGNLKIFLSRESPPQNYFDLGDNQPGLIGWEDLKLDHSECKMMSREFLNDDSLDLQEKLHHVTAGWVTGLILLCEKVKTKGASAVFDFEPINQYFNSEVFSKINRDLQDLLLRIAFFQEITPSMASHLSSPKPCEKILFELVKMNCFLEKGPDPQLKFRLHPLFQRFLLAKAKSRFRPGVYRQIQRNAVRITENEGDLENCFLMLKREEDFTGILNLVINYRDRLFGEGRSNLLEKWAMVVPEKIRVKSPDLLYVLGMVQLPYDPDKSRELFEKSLIMFEASNRDSETVLACAGIVDSILLARKQFGDLDKWTSILYRYVLSLADSNSEEKNAQIITSLYCALSLRPIKKFNIQKTEERALLLLEKNINTNIKIQILVFYILRKLNLGDLSDAAQYIISYSELAESKSVAPLYQIMFCQVKALYHLLAGENDQCQALIKKGLESSDQARVHLFDLFLLGYGLLASLYSGDQRKGSKFLKKMTGSFDKNSNHDLGLFYLLHSAERQSNGDCKNAYIYCETALKHVNQSGIPLLKSITLLLMSQINIELKEFKKASYHLRLSQNPGENILYKQFEFSSLLTRVWLSLQVKVNNKSHILLKEALQFGKEHGYFNTIVWNSKMMSELSVKALEISIEEDYVKELIKRTRITPENPPLEVISWPWPVQIFTFGRFSIMVNGEPLTFSRKAPQTPLSFLKVLISLGGRDVCKNQLTDILWPDADGDSGHLKFGITLHRLRALLGSEGTIKLLNGLVTLNPRVVHVDIWAFNRILWKAEDFFKDGNVDEVIGHIEKALLLYRGPFLGTETLEPVQIQRERMRIKYLKYIEKLGILYEKRGDFDLAVEAVQRGIDVDPSAESFHQNLMCNLQALGRHSEAAKTFYLLKETLLKTFGIKPSPHSEAIFKRMI